MLTRENYQPYLLESYKTLNDIIVKGDLDEVKAALPAGVTIIMSQKHMITPLLIAILHNHEHLIQYLLEHESSNLLFYTKDCNPFYYALMRCGLDKENLGYMRTLFHFLKKNIVIQGLVVGDFNLDVELVQLVSLVRFYQKKLHPTHKIWLEYEIAKQCETFYANYNEHTYWYALADRNLFDFIYNNLYRFSELLSTDQDFYKVIMERIHVLTPRSDVESANLFSAFMCLGNAYLQKTLLSIEYDFSSAMKYFRLADEFANEHRIAIPIETKEFLLAFHFLEGEGQINPRNNQVRKVLFVTALANPAKKNSIEALAVLKNMISFNGSLQAHELIACYIYNANADHGIFMDKMVEYSDIVQGLLHYYGVYTDVNCSRSCDYFKSAADKMISSNPSLALFSCDWAILALSHQQAKKLDPSERVRKASSIFEIMLKLQLDNSNHVPIKAHINKILSFANYSKLPADKTILLRSSLRYFSSINNYFLGKYTAQKLELRLAVLKQFFAEIASPALGLLDDPNNLGEYLGAIAEMCSPILERPLLEACFLHLDASLENISPDTDEQIVQSILVKILDGYYSCLTFLTDQQLESAIRYLEKIKPVIDQKKAKVNFLKYSIFYIEFCDRNPDADKDTKFGAYLKALNFGNRGAVVKVVELFGNTSVDYQRKTSSLYYVLNASLYPDNKKFIDDVGICIANHIKNHESYVEPTMGIEAILNSLRIATQNIPQEMQPLFKMFTLAKRCVEANNNIDKLIVLVKEDYFPAFIKLTLLYIKANKLRSALYCCTRLAAELILNRQILTEKYSLTDEVIDDTCLMARKFITHHCATKKDEYEVAVWSYKFLNHVDSLSISLDRRPGLRIGHLDDDNLEHIDIQVDVNAASPTTSGQTTQATVDRLDIEALILSNAQNSKILKVYDKINRVVNKTSGKRSTLHEIFEMMRRQYGECLLYETPEDKQYYESLRDSNEIELKDISPQVDTEVKVDSSIILPEALTINTSFSKSSTGTIFLKSTPNKAINFDFSPEELGEMQELFDTTEPDKIKIIAQNKYCFLFSPKTSAESIQARPTADIMDYLLKPELVTSVKKVTRN